MAKRKGKGGKTAGIEVISMIFYIPGNSFPGQVGVVDNGLSLERKRAEIDRPEQSRQTGWGLKVNQGGKSWLQKRDKWTEGCTREIPEEKW